MESKECIVCGKIFSKREVGKGKLGNKEWETRKYCSRKCCNSDFKKRRVYVNCLECGKRFQTYLCKGAKRKYCNITCRNVRSKKRYPPRKCIVCSKEYIKKPIMTMKTWQWESRKFCSLKCRLFKYHPIQQAEFWREVLGDVRTVISRKTCSSTPSLRDAENIPCDLIPYGILSPKQFYEHKWTELEIKEFREWNQKNA